MIARLRFAVLCAVVGCQEQPTVPPAPSGCELTPSVLDFKDIESGSSRRMAFTIDNKSDQTRTLTLGEDPPAFVLERPAPTIGLIPGSSVQLMMTFAPVDGLLHLGRFVIREEDPPPDAGSCDLTLPLRGLGSGIVSVEPQSLMFDRLEPGEVAARQFVIHNSRREPIAFSALVSLETTPADGPSVMTVLPSSGSVPPLGAVAVTLFAEPQAASVARGRVIVSADGMDGFVGVSFEVAAGRPAAEVLSPGIDPWRVAYDVGSQPPSFSDRRILVRNVGNTGRVDPLALRVGLPAFTIEPIQGRSEEISIELPNTLVSGLHEGESAAMGVRLLPLSPGPKEFRVQLFFNDPDRPVTEMMIKATAESMPACSMTVQPMTNLQLAPVSDGGIEGSVTFTNTGAAPCIVDEARLNTGAIRGFTIVSGEAPQVEVQPGDSYVVTIAGPRPVTPLRIGALEFHIFNSNSVVQNVSVLWP